MEAELDGARRPTARYRAEASLLRVVADDYSVALMLEAADRLADAVLD